jgi:hypothetical protein
VLRARPQDNPRVVVLPCTTYYHDLAPRLTAFMLGPATGRAAEPFAAQAGIRTKMKGKQTKVPHRRSIVSGMLSFVFWATLAQLFLRR